MLRVYWIEIAPELSDAQAEKAWRMIIKRDLCSYCMRHRATVADHIVPQSDYHRDDRHGWTNLTGACHRCNSRKTSRSLMAVLTGSPVGRHVRAGQQVDW